MAATSSSSNSSHRVNLFELTKKTQKLELEENQITGKWVKYELPLVTIKMNASEVGKLNVVPLASAISGTSPFSGEGYICDFFIEGVHNNSPFDFEVGTTLTKDVVRLISSVSANTPNLNKKPFDEFLPIAMSKKPSDQLFSGKIVPMHTEGAIHTAMRDEVIEKGFFTLPKPIRMLPTGGNAFPLMINMFAGVDAKSVDNTVRVFAKDSTRRVISPNSLIGHRVKAMNGTFFVYHGEKMAADTPVEMVVDFNTFTTARTAILEQAKQVKEYLVRDLESLDVILTSKEFETTWRSHPELDGMLCNPFTRESIATDFQVEVKLKMTVVVYFPTVTPSSCAMDLPSASIWYHNIWNIKDISGGKPVSSAVPYDFTVEYKMMNDLKEKKSNKRSLESPSSSSSSCLDD